MTHRVGNLPMIDDHWWPRPGWRPGRLTYTWHLTFEETSPLHDLVAAYQAVLRPLPGLRLVPAEWLHLTVQSVGYADEISATRLAAAVAAVTDRLAELRPFDLVFHRPRVEQEGIVLPPVAGEAVDVLHGRIRTALAAALGPDAVRTSPEQVRGFRPHVSLAYSAVRAPAGPYAAALAAARPARAVVPVTSAHLICQERLLEPDWLYRWTSVDRAPLGRR